MERTTCCIAGGGPAGMVLGLLLARAGIEVTVLEKHGDFLRDFRGDTVHPTTLEMLDDLGLGERFARLPQNRIHEVGVPLEDGFQRIGNLRLLSGKYDYIAMVPQWDLLNLLAEAAGEYPNFTLRMNTEATGLIMEGETIRGVHYRTADGGTGELHAALTVAGDGRHSALRAASGLESRSWPVPFDIWWFRLPRKENEPEALFPVFTKERPFILINRGEYWQAAAIIRKGSDAQQRREPVSELLAPAVAGPVPWLADRVDALKSWDDVKLLDVRLDRLRRWHRGGLLCIGDAAHAMSPVGGVGINLAVQDAVAAGRILAPALRRGRVSPARLARVRRRRLPATFLVQRMQRLLHEKALRPALEGRFEVTAQRQPFPIRMIRRYPRLEKIPARLIGRGFRPEKIPTWARR
ncbi:MAG: FAD-dependent oxidoreductase [Stackebrandtia sp.]